jgi:ABC-type branched-subunit amino acid transport system substrate-binding protein
MLFAAINRAQSTRVGLVERQLRSTTGFRGATGMIAISRNTGYRVTLPVHILRINSQKRFVPTG